MAKDNTADRVIELAISYLGTKDGSKFIRDYNARNGTHLPDTAAWCAAFVSDIARMAKVPYESIPDFKGCVTGADYFRKCGRYVTKANAPAGWQAPKGAVIFYEWDVGSTGTSRDDGEDHVGFVRYSQNGVSYTVEGNNGNAVSYDWWTTFAPEVAGYGIPLYCIEDPTPEPDPDPKEDDDMSYAQFKDYMKQYEQEKAAQPAAGWAGPALKYAKENKIMSGDANGNMRPYSNITRQEVAQVFYNVFNRYKTEDDLPSWAKDAVHAMIEDGVVNGTGTTEDGKLELNLSQELVRVLCYMVRYFPKEGE